MMSMMMTIATPLDYSTRIEWNHLRQAPRGLITTRSRPQDDVWQINTHGLKDR